MYTNYLDQQTYHKYIKLTDNFTKYQCWTLSYNLKFVPKCWPHPKTMYTFLKMTPVQHPTTKTTFDEDTSVKKHFTFKKSRFCDTEVWTICPQKPKNSNIQTWLFSCWFKRPKRFVFETYLHQETGLPMVFATLPAGDVCQWINVKTHWCWHQNSTA